MFHAITVSSVPHNCYGGIMVVGEHNENVMGTSGYFISSHIHVQTVKAICNPTQHKTNVKIPVTSNTSFFLVLKLLKDDKYTHTHKSVLRAMAHEYIILLHKCAVQ